MKGIVFYPLFLNKFQNALSLPPLTPPYQGGECFSTERVVAENSRLGYFLPLLDKEGLGAVDLTHSISQE